MHRLENILETGWDWLMGHMLEEDLEAYGRTDVTFYKLDDEQFYMDFSVQ